MTNPLQEQELEEADLMMSVSGDVTMAGTVMSRSNDEILGVVGGSFPMKVVVPTFETKMIEQSNPLSGRDDNVIKIVIKSSVDIKGVDNGVISVTGLSGLSGPSTYTAEFDGASRFCLGGDSSAEYDGAQGIFTFELCGDGLEANTEYTLKIRVSNPLVAQDPSEHFISASAAGFNIPPEEMGISNDALEYGIPDTYNPLRIQVPSFSLAHMAQSSFYGGESNQLSLSFTPLIEISNIADNQGVTKYAVISITGLSGASVTGFSVGDDTDDVLVNVTGTSPDLNVSSRFCYSFQPNTYPPALDNADVVVIHSRGRWRPEINTLELVLCDGSILKEHDEIVIHFNVTNPLVDQESPVISLAAEMGGLVGTMNALRVSKPGSPLLGVVNGSDPLKIVIPTFHKMIITQTNPLAGDSNVILVTLQPTMIISGAEGGEIYIDGLPLSPGQLGLSLLSNIVELISSPGDDASAINHFCVNGIPTKATWDKFVQRMTIKLCSDQVIDPEETLVFSFAITNPAEEMQSPDVSISAISGPLDFLIKVFPFTQC